METRICKNCKKEKALQEFEQHYKTCKKCRYQIDFYNPSRKKYLKKWNSYRRRENIVNMLQYLSNHPCVDCGETNPVLLEFDHVKGKKKSSISNLVYRQANWKTINAEIKKCHVRCVRCHRLRTAKTFNWYKGLLTTQ